MKRKNVDRHQLTPMMTQYMDIKDNYEDVILFFRLGDFYEMFFEDAVTAAHELELVLTGKNAGLKERIPMCGVPHHAVDGYIDKLVNKGYKVAICEQVEDASSAKGIVKREVLQIISKGTIMNGELLDEKANNYIGNIFDFKDCFIISYADISTGEFNVLKLNHDQDNLISEILSIPLKEIVVNNEINQQFIELLKNKYKIVVTNYPMIDDNNQYKNLYKHIKDARYLETIKHLLSFLNDTQKRTLLQLQPVKIKDNHHYLKMNIFTKRHLELTENVRLQARTYSLLWLLDKTKTAMGSRMLKQWIENPLLSKEKIEKRYNMVSILIEEFILREELRGLLYKLYDLERLSGRIAYGNANGKDLLQLKQSLKVLPDINKILINLKFGQKIDTLDYVYNLLEESIYETPPLTLKEGYLIKDGYNHELDELKDSRKGGKDFIAKLELEERHKTGIKNLKVGFNKVFGYYIEVSKGNIANIPEEALYERKQTLANCERYVTPLLKEKEALILGAEEKIIKLEYNLFVSIRDELKKYINKIQLIAKALAKIDVLQAFATVSEENNYIRPILIKQSIIDIKDNRHPIIEKVMEESFVPNDIKMDKNTNILLITGPNMSGKSTYMRQLALTVIMAQIGCFVPASFAKIPIFDQIFTRIGASDDLVSGESTFMMEMIEANNAILNATEKSLILFDELGRGTATYDGMSLAYAIIEYIHNHIQAKTLFSTHYHELVELEKDLINLKNVHVSAYEEDGKLTFIHKVRSGSIDKSYGIHVAKLANLPSKLISRANEILAGYEKNDKSYLHRQLKGNINTESKEEPVYNELLKMINKINHLEITPLEALNLIYQIKMKIKELEVLKKK